MPSASSPGPESDSFAVPSEQSKGEEAPSFEHMVSAVDDYAIFTMDKAGIILNWNRGAQKIKQYHASEIVGQHFSRFYMVEDCASHLPERELVIATETGKFTDEGWRLRKDGSRFWASVTITAIRTGEETTGFLKITRDLTERAMTAEALRQSEERFRILLESVHDYAIFMLDPEGHVITWNQGARKIKGYEQQEIIGSHFSIFYPPETAGIGLPEMMLSKALAEGRAEHEGWRIRKDGSRFWGNAIINVLYDEQGQLRGFTKITRDLTHRRNAEMLLENSRRKDVFLATLAHELRNPLAPILPGLDVILRSPGDVERVSQVAGMIQRQVGQMKHLIDDLLDMSRIATGKIELRKKRLPLLDVINLAVETIEPSMMASRQEFTMKLPSGNPDVDVDPHRISQMISNLLSNASRYTQTGGKISLETTVTPTNELRIAVRDNGVGIPLELQDTIFDLFEQGNTQNNEGLGIGLTLVKKIAAMHGGSVSVLSEGENKGSAFFLLLPVLASPSA